MSTLKVEVTIELDNKVVNAALKEATDHEIRAEFYRRGMTVDVDIDEVLHDASIEELRRELENRDMAEIFSGKLRARLELVYEEVRRLGSAPRVLREYIYDHLGRILP